MQLPIDVIPDTYPPIFRWNHVVEGAEGRVVQRNEGRLPPMIEVAVARMVAIAKQLLKENSTLKGQVEGLTERVAARSELLGKKAEQSKKK